MSRQPLTVSNSRPWEAGLLDRYMPWMDRAKRWLYQDLREIEGPEHHPEIVAFARETGQDWIKDDETPWCATFVGAMLARSGFKHSGRANARSYLDVGTRLKEPVIGCIVVLWRGSPDAATGHVGFLAGFSEDGKGVYLLGGNQGNAVSNAEYPVSRVLGYFWPEPETPVHSQPGLYAGLAPAQPVRVQVPETNRFGQMIYKDSAVSASDPLIAGEGPNTVDRMLGLGVPGLAKFLKGKKTLIGGLAALAASPAATELLVNAGVPPQIMTDVLPLLAYAYGGGGLLSKFTDLVNTAKRGQAGAVR